MIFAGSGGSKAACGLFPYGTSGDLAVQDATDRPGKSPPWGAAAKPAALSRAILPPKVRRQRYRPPQHNIPNSRQVRDLLKRTAAEHIGQEKVVPPLAMHELREHAARVLALAGVDPVYEDYATIIVSNEAWRDTLAHIPYERRLLLLPKCLRAEKQCRGTIDEFGLLCKRCGSCLIHELTTEAEQLDYAVLVAEGSAVVLKMIETGRIDAVIGVSCMNVLKECFPRMEARAIPGIAIPLLQDGCANTTLDLDWIRDAIQLTSEDRTYHLNLDAVKRDVQGWFTEESLETIIGPVDGETEQIARSWLARDGKRWRPYLTVCVSLALRGEEYDGPPSVPNDLKKLAVAVECFHKASLIHDDIEDDDERRYGQRTMHVEYGVPVALNVGDFLLGEGYRLIGELDSDAQTRADMLCTASDGHLTLSRGQGAELCWSRRPRVLSSVEVLDIFRQKTAPAFEVALRLGAHHAGAPNEVHEVLSAYSESLGIAYQVRDDVQDCSGEGDSNDLGDLRPSLILAIAHKRAAGASETELIASLWNHTRTYAEAADKVHRIVKDRGVIDTAKELLEAYAQQAIRSLLPLKNPTLKGLLRRVIGAIFGDALIEGHCRELEARNAGGGKARPKPAS